MKPPSRSSLYSVEPDGTKVDAWIFEELLGDDPLDKDYTHVLGSLDLGGEGSGNFGHAGRPGEVGGSAPADGATSDNLTAEAKEAYRKRYEGWDAARKEREKTVAADTGHVAEMTPPDGRFSTEEKRQVEQEIATVRLQKLVPKTEITAAMPQLIRAAEHTADVLEEMQALGLKMPDKIQIGRTHRRSPHAAVGTTEVQVTDTYGRTEEVLRERVLNVFIPMTLPDDVSLDDAAMVTFAGPSDIDPATVGDTERTSYDRFSSGEHFRDIIVHEMGHIQAGHRGRDIPGAPKMLYGIPTARTETKNKQAIRRAALRVSVYATTNEDEFIAESFTRLYRGETLAPDSLALYEKLNGPKVPKR